MAGRRIRIDMQDKDGASYTFKVEGSITREKLLKMFDMMDLMDIEQAAEAPEAGTPGTKIWHIIDKYFPVGGFTSSEVREKYEDEFNQPIQLSMISTYLARFSAKGRMGRARTGREWTYQVARVPQNHPRT